MNEDDLEAQKLEIISALATCPGAKADKFFLSAKVGRVTFNFNEVLDLLVKEHLVRYNRLDYDFKGKSAYELTEKAKTKYGITSIKPFYTYIPQEREPTKYVNIVNSAGVIVDTREVMDKGTLRTILAGICIFTIIAIVVLIFLSQ